eukprot:s5030_g4.t1
MRKKKEKAEEKKREKEEKTRELEEKREEEEKKKRRREEEEKKKRRRREEEEKKKRRRRQEEERKERGRQKKKEEGRRRKNKQEEGRRRNKNEAKGKRRKKKKEEKRYLRSLRRYDHFQKFIDHILGDRMKAIEVPVDHQQIPRSQVGSTNFKLMNKESSTMAAALINVTKDPDLKELSTAPPALTASKTPIRFQRQLQGHMTMLDVAKERETPSVAQTPNGCDRGLAFNFQDCRA